MVLEPAKNPNPRYLVDPPGWLRHLITAVLVRPLITPHLIERRRIKSEAKRRKAGEPHVVEYFHQLDDPYSHLAAQVLATFAERYDVQLKVHLIRATGGASQPAFDKLARWARTDCGLIAPHLGLAFPQGAGLAPDPTHQGLAGRALVALSDPQRVAQLNAISEAMWAGDTSTLERLAASGASTRQLDDALDAGSARLHELQHYSGATFYYAGEWYWGVDRLYHLERRLRSLGVGPTADAPLIVPIPKIDVAGVDARHLRLDFYPSLNSPYTAIIYERTLALKAECGIEFHHKPVLPMIMRGVPAPQPKAKYILFDTKREAQAAGVPFGPLLFPVGEPVRQAYSLLPWARSLGKDEALMRSLLRHAWTMGVGLHTRAGMRRAVEAAGLDWGEARTHMATADWKPLVEKFQDEMVEGLGLWGVPSYRLSGPDGEPDVAVWGQDRLWLIAKEIRRRSQVHGPLA
jgi:2-hydroxychromene-2-carboxylate isomerase